MSSRSKLNMILLSCLLAAGQQPPTLLRIPLKKREVLLRTPKTSSITYFTDPTSGTLIQYDPKPSVELVDRNAGLYHLAWTDQEGERQTATYQVPNLLDVVVVAKAAKGAEGRFRYSYLVKNLPSSGERLSGFALQTFGPDFSTVSIPNVYIGKMSASLGAGSWVRFAFLKSFVPPLTGGQSVQLELESSSLPGVVECAVNGGESGIRGSREDIPTELIAILPGYESWPRGLTIGPVDHLTGLSASGRQKQVLKWLPLWEHENWITESLGQQYQSALKRGSLRDIRQRLDSDLSNGGITIEVFSIIKALAE